MQERITTVRGMAEQRDIGARRWLILAAGISAQTTVCAFLYGLAFVIPELQRSAGISLAEAGLLVSAPILGLLLALIAWGAAADRYGERLVMTIGVAGTGVMLLACLALDGLVAFGGGLVLAGMFGASVNAASGRVVLGWFAANQRGLAMGLRQTSQPLGVGIAAATLPPLARHWGFAAALAVPAVLCLLAALFVLLVVIDPPRPAPAATTTTASPYRLEPATTLLRLHTASALLVAPQFCAATFALTYLVSRRDWDPVVAGRLVAVVQLVGAAGRIVVGVWSDRVASRMRPMRVIAVLVTGCMVLWCVGDLLASPLAVAAVVAALIVTVTPNGLGFTSTAELAGPHWAGRALGVQNTGQNAMAMVAAPMFGALITAAGYPTALVVAAAFPAVAVALTPVPGERRLLARDAV
jgi:sugar phosphate permease